MEDTTKWGNILQPDDIGQKVEGMNPTAGKGFSLGISFKVNLLSGVLVITEHNTEMQYLLSASDTGTASSVDLRLNANSSQLGDRECSSLSWTLKHFRNEKMFNGKISTAVFLAGWLKAS